VAAGVSPDASLAAVNRVIADFPSVQVKDQAQYKQDQACQINQVLVLFYLLPVAAGFRGGARITVYCGPRPEGGAGHHPCVQIYAEASGSKRDARHHADDPRDSVAALLGSPPPAISRS